MTDATADALQTWLDAHPQRPLKPWERRVLDMADEAPGRDEDDDPHGKRADEEAMRWENQWERQAGWNR